MDDRVERPAQPGKREAAVNAPAVILISLVVLAAMQALRGLVSRDTDIDIILTLAFLPARYDPAALKGIILPGGRAADLWTFVTYVLLHGNWVHLAINAVWLLVFGSAVAWRFGTLRFLAFSALCAVAGAALHLAFHRGELVPMVGASTAISGQMAASLWFMFQPGAPLGLFRVGGRSAFRVPALPLSQSLSDRRVLAFVAVWFGINLITGAGAIALAGEGETIAWQAHVGGFLAGLVLFPLFDPIGPGIDRGRPESLAGLASGDIATHHL